MGVAAVAAHFPGFVRWAYAAEHPSAEPAPIRPTAYTPQFFAGQDYAVIERLAQLIIPSDETPGAREAGVAEFVDFMVAHDQEQQQAMRTGLAWFHAHVERTLRSAFPRSDGTAAGVSARAARLPIEVSRRRGGGP